MHIVSDSVKQTSHMLLKSINQQKVLFLIYSEGPISRVELAEKTGLSRQTVTNIVNRLLKEKIIVTGSLSTWRQEAEGKESAFISTAAILCHRA